VSITISQDSTTLGNIKMSTMSFNQEGLWLLDQMELGSAINAMTATVEVSGALAPAVLETSLDLLVERHAILRTTFHMQEGQLRQVIAPQLHIPLRVVDLQAHPAAAQIPKPRGLQRTIPSPIGPTPDGSSATSISCRMRRTQTTSGWPTLMCCARS